MRLTCKCALLAALVLTINGCERYSQRPLESEALLARVERQRRFPDPVVSAAPDSPPAPVEFTLVRAVTPDERPQPALKEAAPNTTAPRHSPASKHPFPIPRLRSRPHVRLRPGRQPPLSPPALRLARFLHPDRSAPEAPGRTQPSPRRARLRRNPSETLPSWKSAPRRAPRKTISMSSRSPCAKASAWKKVLSCSCSKPPPHDPARRTSPILKDLWVQSLTGTEKGTGTMALIHAENTEQARRKEADTEYRTWNLRAGQRYIANIPIEQLQDVFVLPADAITDEGADKIVLIQNGDSFEPKKVIVLYQDSEEAVLDGKNSELFPGDVVVQHGAFGLRLALKGGGGEEEAGYHHHHHHH